MDLSAGAADYLAELSHRPGARAPATLTEIWDAEWSRTGLDTVSGVGRPFSDARDELVQAIETEGGAPLDELARRFGVNMGAAATADQRIAAMGAIVDALPEEKRQKLELLKDVRRRASEKAQAIEKDAADTASATYGMSGVATSFVAGIARQTVDPVNIAAMIATAPMGGSLAGPILPMLARQAAAGALSQAAVEPYVQATRAELGLESGLGRAAGNVLEAGIGSAGLAGLFRASAGAVRAVRGRPAVDGTIRVEAGETAPVAPAPLRDSGVANAGPFERLAPDGQNEIERVFASVDAADLEAAARVAERDQVIGAELKGATAAEAVDNLARLDDTARAIESGRPIEPMPTDTRGGGQQFHGTSQAELVLDDNHYSTLNYYGQGFYTTDAMDIAEGYAKNRAKRGGSANVFQVKENRPLKILDGEAPLSPELEAQIRKSAEGLDLGDGRKHVTELDGLVLDALDEKPKNLREFYDAVRENGTADGHSADTLQETFDNINFALRALGFDGFSHAGGLRTNKPKHKVVIYFSPEKDITVTNVARAETPAIEVKPGKRFGVRAMDEEKYSLFQFLASRGGLDPDQPAFAQGWLQNILDGNPFVPGFGTLLRKGGMKLDDAWRQATDAGYINDPGVREGTVNTTSANDLLNLIGEEGRGNRQYRNDFRPGEKVDPAEQRALREQARAELEQKFDDRMAELQITNVTKRDRVRALQILEKEGEPDALLAYERALIENENAQEAIRAARTTEQELHIPGWDVADDARATSPDGGAAAGEVRGRSRDGGSGDGPRADRGGAGAEGEGQQLGNPALANDAERALADYGGDLEIWLQEFDGSVRKVSARQALAEAEADARAAAELTECIGMELAT